MPVIGAGAITGSGSLQCGQRHFLPAEWGGIKRPLRQRAQRTRSPFLVGEGNGADGWRWGMAKTPLELVQVRIGGSLECKAVLAKKKCVFDKKVCSVET